MTRETVAMETPAALATSWTVGERCRFSGPSGEFLDISPMASVGYTDQTV
jgi:hypothetical protein